MFFQKGAGIMRLDDIRNLGSELQHAVLGNLERDKPVWSLVASSSYRVRATYRRLVDGGCLLPNAKIIWVSKSPIKVRIFMCLIAKNAILTWENLQKNRMVGPGLLYTIKTCITCN